LIPSDPPSLTSSLLIKTCWKVFRRPSLRRYAAREGVQEIDQNVLEGAGDTPEGAEGAGDTPLGSEGAGDTPLGSKVGRPRAHLALSDLQAVRAGVYLLVHRERGEQYVGGTYGADGFLGRWLTYLDGHGGNVAMRELGASANAYDVAILETLGSGDDDSVVAALESAWKVKLGTRVKGLNRN